MCTFIKSKVDQHIHSLLNEHVMKGYTEDKQVSGLPEIWNQLEQQLITITDMCLYLIRNYNIDIIEMGRTTFKNVCLTRYCQLSSRLCKLTI